MYNFRQQPRANEKHLKQIALFIFAAMLGILPLSASSASEDGPSYTVRFAPNMIAFPDVDRGRGSHFVAILSDAEMDSEMSTILRSLQVESFTPIAPMFRHMEDDNVDRWGNRIELVDMTGDYSVEFRFELSAADIEALESFEAIESVHFQSEMRYFFTPNDEYFDDQWYLENDGGTLEFEQCQGETDTTSTADYDIDASNAWDSVDDPGCLIGVIDSGVRGTHEDFSGSLHSGSVSTDNCGHGTEVSGVIAAAGDNSVGIAGVARPDKDESSNMLVVLKNVSTNGCSPSPSRSCTAISNFTSMPTLASTKVINESWGMRDWKWDYDTALRDCHLNAYKAGVLLVAASGNVSFPCDGFSADSCQTFPAAFNHLVTSVSGLDPNGVNVFPAYTFTDLVAGGSDIVTTSNAANDAYAGQDGRFAKCGTSLAAPIVTGSAAMILGANASLTNDDLASIVRRTAEDLGASGRDDLYGHGQLQLSDAIDFVSSPNLVYHKTIPSLSGPPYTATYIGSRTSQEFANTPLNSASNTFESFHVKIYELEATASFSSKGAGETVVAAWALPRLSTGFPNQDKIDGNLLTSSIATDEGALTQTSVPLTTYTYKVFEQSDTTSCLGWYPIQVSSAGTCGSSHVDANFDYTFVTEPSNPFADSNQSSWIKSTATMRVDQSSGKVELRLDGLDHYGSIEFTLADVGGRIVRSATAERDQSMIFATTGLPSGVYFATGKSGQHSASQKVVILR